MSIPQDGVCFRCYPRVFHCLSQQPHPYRSLLLRSYSVQEARVVFEGDNFNLTTSGMSATINQVFISVSAFSVLTIIQDGQSICIAMAFAYLGKKGLDEENVDKGDPGAMEALEEEHAAATKAWVGRPRAAEMAMIGVLAAYFVTFGLALGTCFSLAMFALH